MSLVSGTVKDSFGNPTKRLVRVFRRSTGKMLAETHSDWATGAWSCYVNVATTEFVTVIVSDSGGGDQYYDETAACIHGHSYLSDEKSHTVNKLGLADISYDLMRFGESSIYFTGSTLDNVVAEATAPDFILGDTFTIEMSIYLIALPGGPCRVLMIGNNNETNSLALEISSSGGLSLGVTSSGTTKVVASAGTISTGTWMDVVATCDRGSAKLFVNATKVAGPTNITLQTSANSYLRLGGDVAGGVNYHLNGYIYDFRATKGINRFSDFDPVAKIGPIEFSPMSFNGDNAVILDNVNPV